jgi:ankyrin repeat protein
MTALMYAAENNHVEVIEYLVEKGANINVKDLVSPLQSLQKIIKRTICLIDF